MVYNIQFCLSLIFVLFYHLFDEQSLLQSLFLYNSVIDIPTFFFLIANLLIF